MSKVTTFLNSIARKCKHCNAEFEITPDKQKMFAEKGLSLPEHCYDCREKKKKFAYFACVDCGEQFSVNQLEGEWFEKQGMSIPKRCPACRQKRRKATGR